MRLQGQLMQEPNGSLYCWIYQLYLILLPKRLYFPGVVMWWRFMVLPLTGSGGNQALNVL